MIAAVVFPVAAGKKRISSSHRSKQRFPFVVVGRRSATEHPFVRRKEEKKLEDTKRKETSSSGKNGFQLMCGREMEWKGGEGR